MDRELIEAAIRKAINGGAVRARPRGPMPRPEMDLVRAGTDVEIEPHVLQDYLADLKHDQQMALFDSALAVWPVEGSVPTNLEPVARRLLARAIASNDVSGTVETFCSYVEKNAAPMIAVMAVAGVKTGQEIRLGPHVRLVPLTSLPPSYQRGSALGLVDEIRHPAGGASSALVTNVDAFEPMFCWPIDGRTCCSPTDASVKREAARQRAILALNDLNEARLLFPLLGIMRAAMRMFWVEAKDPLMGIGVDLDWRAGREIFVAEGVEVDVGNVGQLAAAYFNIEQKLRREMLHIPLDRFDRAVRELDDLADASIDLGIALEALLLHELNGPSRKGKHGQDRGRDRGELRFRLSLRGAWLAGNDPTERADIHQTLKGVYDLRSVAVHTGRVDPTQKNYQKFGRGIQLCQQLIRRVIDEGGRVDWDALVLGGPARRA
jgi:hypothetical protein